MGSLLPILIIAALAFRFFAEMQTGAQRSRRRKGSQGIACIPNVGTCPATLCVMIHNPPDLGANPLVVNAIAKALTQMVTEDIPRVFRARLRGARCDVQISYALIPGQQQLFQVDVAPQRLKKPIAAYVEEILGQLPVFPLIGGPLLLAVRNRIEGTSWWNSKLPDPFTGLVDRYSQIPSVAQVINQVHAQSPPRTEVAFTPQDCESFLQSFPQNEHALWLLGLMYSQEGQVEQALETYGRLLENPQWQQARVPRAELLAGAGRHSEAVGELDALLAVRPTFVPALLAKADILRMTDQNAEALRLAKQAVELDPENPTAHLSCGLAQATMQEHVAAIDHLTKALTLAPTEPLPLLFRSEQWAMLGNHNSALADVDQFLTSRPGWVPALQVKAQVLLGLNRFEESAKVLDEIVAHEPNERTLLLRGRALASAGKLETAHSDFTQVVGINPQHAQAWLHRAQVSFELHRMDDARDDVEKALAIEPALIEGLFLRGLIALREDSPEAAASAFDQVLAEDPVHERALLRRGELHLAQQEADEALALFERAHATYPSSAEALCLRAETQRVQGESAAALADFEAALVLDPQLAGAYFGRARIHAEAGDHREALTEIDRAIAVNPDWAEARWFRATLLMSQGDVETAVSDLEYLRTQTFDNALPTQLLAAQALLHSERYDEAIAACERLLDTSPDFWMAWVWHAQAHIYRDGPGGDGSGFDKAQEAQPEQAAFIQEQRQLAETAYLIDHEDYPEAIRILTEILEENPESLEARIRRGVAQWYSQQLVEAIDDFSAILQDHPRMVAARAGRGQVLAELGDDEAALLDLNLAVEESERQGADRRLAYALSGRALTAMAEGDWDQADADLDRSQSLVPGNAWSMYHRGLRYHAAGDRAAATWCFRLALVLDDPRLPPHKRAKAQAYVNASPTTGNTASEGDKPDA
ncbi:MAG: tetratricopeptide repeat protein [Planctomycetes bacterium]|nr:tetratricopeptide repeat protein [Planctomycetota bacterium]